MLVIFGGCTNRPGALELRVTAEDKGFEPNEPIRITATFSVNAGVVCIPKPAAGAFDIELEQTNIMGDFVRKPVKRTVIARCGTGYQWILLIYPMLYCGCLMDVADVAGRFHAIAEGKERTYSFDLLPTRDGFVALDGGHPDYADWMGGERFKPGFYTVKIKFQAEPSNIYPPPLFWQVCEQPVEAETEFLILSQSP